MVKPREEFLGAITNLDKNKTGTIKANSALLNNISGSVHTARSSAPTTGDGYGAFWVQSGSKTTPKFTRNDGYTISFGDDSLYLYLDGSKTMTGPLNMGGNSIINASTVDGYNLQDFSTHISNTSNPHHTSIANLYSGTLAQLNAAISDTDVVGITRTLTAGNGLTGGGDLSSDRTFNVVAADSTITVNADSIQVGVIADANHGSLSGGSLHAVATQSVAGFESAADKTKLDGIAAGAQVNPNIWSVFSDGTITASPGTTLDTFRFRSANSILTTTIGSNDVTYGDNLLLTVNQGNITHGSISGLSSDDHTQYVLASGTRAMTGSLSFGGFNITNAGTVDGYNLYSQFQTLASHLTNYNNPHQTTLANIGTGTFAQLNAKISDGYVLVPTVRNLTAGNGLTGGGNLSVDRTFNVVAADSTITVNADSIQVGVIADANHGSLSGGSLHAVATTSVAGFESAADKTKLDGIAAGAQVNPNIWSVFSDGTTTASPGSQSDTFRFRSANNILTTAIGSNDVTYGDNLLLTITQGNIDHGSIGGLSDDDHTQYLLVSGTRAMTGNLSLGTHNITNVGTVDGVTVSAHASRHLYGGADEINADQVNIDFVPANYTRTTDTTYSTSTYHLSAHLKGVDLELVKMLKLDGTRAMTGNLNMGVNAVTFASGIGNDFSTLYGFNFGSNYIQTIVNNSIKKMDFNGYSIEYHDTNFTNFAMGNLAQLHNAVIVHNSRKYNITRNNGNGNVPVVSMCNWI